MSELNTFPRLCGSVAGVASKLGVALHDAGYNELGIEFKYIAVGTDELERAIAAFKKMDFRGFGVSMPFKTEVIGYLDETSDEVKTIGACNTVVLSKGRLSGYNTDWRGAIGAMKEAGIKQPTTAMIIGSGGVARAIAYGLKKEGWKTWIASRNIDAGAKLRSQLGLEGNISIEDQSNVEVDLIVNATPVVDIKESPVRLLQHKSAKSLLDVVFNPKETPIVKLAKQNGLIVVPGWRMLPHQAIFQFELYTEKKAPIDTMSKVLSDALG